MVMKEVRKQLNLLKEDTAATAVKPAPMEVDAAQLRDMSPDRDRSRRDMRSTSLGPPRVAAQVDLLVEENKKVCAL